MGLFYRTIRLVEHGIKPVYVFDGKPPEMKSDEVRNFLFQLYHEAFSSIPHHYLGGSILGCKLWCTCYVKLPVIMKFLTVLYYVQIVHTQYCTLVIHVCNYIKCMQGPNENQCQLFGLTLGK